MRAKLVVPVLASLTLFDVVGASAQTVDSPAWNSTYVGGSVGHQSTGTDVNTDSLDSGSFSGGVFAGRNFRNGTFVFGVEGGLLLAEKQKFELTSTDGSVIMSGLQGSVRTRLGFLISDALLVYAAGGAAFLKEEVVSNNTSQSDSKTRVGLMVGGGIEAAFAKNWSGRVDITFSDYGSDTYLSGINVDTKSVAVQGGVAFHF